MNGELPDPAKLLTENCPDVKNSICPNKELSVFQTYLSHFAVLNSINLYFKRFISETFIVCPKKKWLSKVY